MPEIGRIGDPTTDGDTVAQGSGNVFAGGMPVTRVNPDFTAGHSCYPPTTFSAGSTTVFCNNLSIVVVGSPIVPHSCPSSSPHGGSLAAGMPTVLVES